VPYPVAALPGRRPASERPEYAAPWGRHRCRRSPMPRCRT